MLLDSFTKFYTYKFLLCKQVCISYFLQWGSHVVSADWTSMHTAQVKSAALALPQSSLSISKLLPLPCSPGVCFLLHNI